MEQPFTAKVQSEEVECRGMEDNPEMMWSALTHRPAFLVLLVGMTYQRKGFQTEIRTHLLVNSFLLSGNRFLLN
ncbi:hypothetical protein CEXT_257211 [Caerostris extrusa]|uniref:Uncharacterized protein n=1 Tax=Caerostris extrusa TaxID=172846 RepID=A0AAV4Q892_CAEEX|nr:hypothetical protein CEXT_257211 [Caerostris extrusa]